MVAIPGSAININWIRFFIYAISLRRCYDRFLLKGDDEAMKQLVEKINKLKNIK